MEKQNFIIEKVDGVLVKYDSNKFTVTGDWIADEESYVLVKIYDYNSNLVLSYGGADYIEQISPNSFFIYEDCGIKEINIYQYEDKKSNLDCTNDTKEKTYFAKEVLPFNPIFVSKDNILYNVKTKKQRQLPVFCDLISLETFENGEFKDKFFKMILPIGNPDSLFKEAITLVVEKDTLNVICISSKLQNQIDELVPNQSDENLSKIMQEFMQKSGELLETLEDSENRKSKEAMYRILDKYVNKE